MFDLTVELIALGSIIGTYSNGFRFFYKNLWELSETTAKSLVIENQSALKKIAREETRR